MSQGELVKVLLIEDDEDDFIIARELFAEIRGTRFTLDWVKTFEVGVKTMCRNQHDAVLVDYRLGARNGVELLEAAHFVTHRLESKPKSWAGEAPHMIPGDVKLIDLRLGDLSRAAVARKHG
jgi:response regulator RpfG family c-di-GMP phosphodiesterase